MYCVCMYHILSSVFLSLFLFSPSLLPIYVYCFFVFSDVAHFFTDMCLHEFFLFFFFFSPTPLYSSSFSSPQRCLVFYPLRFCRCTDCGNAFWAWILWSLHLMGCNRLACNSCIRSCALYLLFVYCILCCPLHILLYRVISTPCCYTLLMHMWKICVKAQGTALSQEQRKRRQLKV